MPDSASSEMVEEIARAARINRRAFDLLMEPFIAATYHGAPDHPRAIMDRQLYRPVVVQGIFAVETYLKALIAADEGEAPRGHRLREELWDKLSAESQQMIEGTASPQIFGLEALDFNLGDVLASYSRNIYTDWRYYWQNDPRPVDPHELDSVLAVLDEALQRGPQWSDGPASL